MHRITMVATSKKIVLEVDPIVHLTGPDTIEARTPIEPHEVRLPMTAWDILSGPKGFFDWSGFRVVSIEDAQATEPAAQFISKARMVMWTAAQRVVLDLADTVKVVGPETLDVPICDDRMTLTIWDILSQNTPDGAMFNEQSGVRVVSVEPTCRISG